MHRRHFLAAALSLPLFGLLRARTTANEPVPGQRMGGGGSSAIPATSPAAEESTVSKDSLQGAIKPSAVDAPTHGSAAPLGETDFQRWKRSPRHPVLQSDDAKVAALLAAIEEDAVVEFGYGYHPELPEYATRHRIAPAGVFKVDGFPDTYVSGYSHTQEAERTFRIDRIFGTPTKEPPVVKATAGI